MKTYTSILLLLFFFFSLNDLYSQKNEVVDITFARDGIHLKGRFFMAEGNNHLPTLLLLPGFPGNNKDVLGMGQRLSEAGINVMMFNYSGTYESQGEWNFANTLKDIENAWKFLHEAENIQKFNIDTNRITMGGYSYGGGMGLSYAINHPEVTKIFSISGTDHGKFMQIYSVNPDMVKFIDDMFADLQAPESPVRFAKGAMPSDIDSIGMESMDKALFLKENAARLKDRDILLIAGWNDRRISIEDFMLPLYRALRKEGAESISIHAFQDDHSFGNSREDMASLIIDWIKK